jgi:formylglycine-generating enzyme required for sulfatase activity
MKKLTSLYRFFPALIIIGFLSFSGLPQQIEQKSPAGTRTVQKNFLGMEFVKIEPGTFKMGSDSGDFDEKPVREVRISQAFWMGVTEVTQEEWKEVMGNNPSYFQKCGKCPVEQVSWNDIQEFIQTLNSKEKDGSKYRLPTEAEWEYAARAGTSGDFAGDLDSMGWYDVNSETKTHPVKTKSANPWGLYDMHGNVWEWVQDWYSNGKYPEGSAKDPVGPDSGSNRAIRGGGWDNNAFDLRSANRFSDSPKNQFHDLGFRLVRIIE